MRALLESQAAALAALRHSDEEMREIYASLNEMEQAVEKRMPGTEAHDRYNTAIAAASHNPVLIGFLSFLRSRLHDLAAQLRIRTMESMDRARLVLEEHRRVVKAIDGGDPAAAQEATLTHLKNAAKRADLEIYNK